MKSSRYSLLIMLVFGWILPALGEVRWKQITPEPHPPKRTGHDMAYDSARGVIVLYGGTRAENRFGDTWEFNVADETWTLKDDLPNSPPPLAAHKMFYDEKNGRTVLFGGQENLFDFLGDIWEYDGTAWSKAEISDGTRPVARGGHSLAYDTTRGNALLFGGRKKIGEEEVELLGDTWLYDGTTRSWTPVARAGSPSPREGAGLVYDPWSDRFILFGGSFFDNDRSNETWMFDPASAAWSQVETEHTPSKRSAASMAALDADRIVVSCGTGYWRNYVSDTCIFDGQNWRDAGIGGPKRRAGAPLVRAGTQAYLFGGFNGGVLEDTWRLYCEGCEPVSKKRGDLNEDGRVDRSDLFLLSTQWAIPHAAKAGTSSVNYDLTGDGRVDIKDMVRFLSDYRTEP